MKKWSAILACLLLAAGIWLIMNLSGAHSSLETVPVIAESSLEGYAPSSAGAVDVTARCKASGFALIRLALSGEAVRVRISPDDFTPLSDGAFAVDKDRMYRYIPEIFGTGVSVEAFAAMDFKFRFEREDYIKVPVEAICFTGFQPQYIATAGMSLTPDSVAVYGSPRRLKDIKAVYTEPVTLGGLKANAHGIVSLQIPEGTRLSATETAYELPVARFVDISESVTVSVVNAPSGRKLHVLPQKADITYRCSFPPSSDPRGRTLVYVDWREYEASINGECMLKTTDTAPDVISVIVKPQSCKCVEVPVT